MDALAGAGWRKAGMVSIDGATVVLGDPRAFLSWRAKGAPFPVAHGRAWVLQEKLAFYITMDDLDCPVEKCFAGADVVAVRVEQVNDIAELAGSWSEIGKLSLDSPCCVVIDPTLPIPDQALELLRSSPTEDTDLCTATGHIVGALLIATAGSYLVEVFTTEDETLGVRLRLRPSSLGGDSTATTEITPKGT
jgi:hypothetical protein